MFKLPNLPSSKAECHDLADFAELLAWDKGLVSAREIEAYLGRLDENDSHVGCDDNDAENAAGLDEVMNEIERRQAACGGGYPFVLEREGTVLRHALRKNDHRHHLYHYLLLSTRLNMTENRVHARIDGADLLEEIAAEALRCYLGPRRARALVFGTAARGRGTFAEKIDHLCRELGEGGCFKKKDRGSINANDDKLDTVAWLPFADKSSCQLVVFGQCKTGTNWDGMVTQLQPAAFIKRWMHESYSHDPVRAFCISEAANRARWVGYTVYSGLLFDRCRIVDFCEHPGPVLLAKIKKWTAAAKATVVFKAN